MAEHKHAPVHRDQTAFLTKAGERKCFKEADDDLAVEYQIINQRLKASTRAA